jgi:hypothetical protein
MKTRAKKHAKKRAKKRASRKWIQAAIKRPGALHKALHVPEGVVIPLALLHKAEAKGGCIAREAYLAETLRKFRKKKRRK